MSFLERLIQAKPPQNPFADAKTNLSVFISLLKPKVHFLKVTRVVCNSFDLHGFRVYFLSRHRFDLLLNTAKAKYFNPKS